MHCQSNSSQKHIKTKYLSAMETSKLHPLDQGIINNFSLLYQRSN